MPTVVDNLPEFVKRQPTQRLAPLGHEPFSLNRIMLYAFLFERILTHHMFPCDGTALQGHFALGF